MGTKFPFFNFPVCKIYLGTWAHRARRTRRVRGHVEYVEHVGTLGTPFSRLVVSTQLYGSFDCVLKNGCQDE